MTDTPYTHNRVLITRIVMLHSLFCLGLRAVAWTLPVQLAQPVLSRAGLNLSHIAYKLSGLGELLTRHYGVALCFTLLLFLLPVLLLVFPRKRLPAIGFSLLFLLFIITTNVYVNFNQHYLFFLWLATLPFCAKRDETFSLLWEGLRYYACWVYGSTFILKLINGAMWQWDYGLMTMKEQVAESVLLNPDSTLTMIYTWFIQHGVLLNIGQKVVFLAEGLFLIGFFTRKYDRLLILSALFIFISTSLFANVFFIEQLGILIIALISPQQWSRLKSRLSKQKPAQIVSTME